MCIIILQSYFQQNNRMNSTIFLQNKQFVLIISEEHLTTIVCPTSALGLGKCSTVLVPSLGGHLDRLGRRCQDSFTGLGRVWVLAIVKGELFPLLDLPLGKHGQLGHVGVQVVDEHAVDAQIGVAAMVDKVRKIAVEGSINCVNRFIFPGIKVEVEQVRPSLGIVLLAPLLRLLVGDHLPHVLHHEGPGGDPLHGLDSPPTPVVCPKDRQFVFPTFLDNSVDAIRGTGASLVTFIDRTPNL